MYISADIRNVVIYPLHTVVLQIRVRQTHTYSFQQVSAVHTTVCNCGGVQTVFITIVNSVIVYSRQSAPEGGKAVSPTHRPSLSPPGNIPGTHFC